LWYDSHTEATTDMTTVHNVEIISEKFKVRLYRIIGSYKKKCIIIIIMNTSNGNNIP
jgi:hypothetical protein